MPIAPPDAPPTAPGPFGLEEIRQLRATVGARGTVRVLVSLLTFVSWAGLALLAHASAPERFTLIPLAVLWVGFELGAGLHIGVERIGRYLRVFYETGGGMPKWETAIALFGRSEAARATRVRPLLEREFALAAVVNLGLALSDRAIVQGELTLRPATVVVLAAHLLFLGRIWHLGRQTRRQRELDESAFQAVAGELGR
jgi:hypothetical protein